MGRPPLGVVETKIRLSPETRNRILALVGPSKMAAWIRAAIEAELARQEAEARRLRSDD
jgi:predicted DNA-binding protein